MKLHVPMKRENDLGGELLLLSLREGPNQNEAEGSASGAEIYLLNMTPTLIHI